jgi:hypothetical protein
MFFCRIHHLGLALLLLFPLLSRSEIQLTPLHQADSFSSIEEKFSDLCRLISGDSSSECFTKSYRIPSSSTPDLHGLESALSKEFAGRLRLSREGFSKNSIQKDLRFVLEKLSIHPRHAEILAEKRTSLESAVRGIGNGKDQWTSGVTWSPMDEGRLLVILKKEPRWDLTEVLVLGFEKTESSF